MPPTTGAEPPSVDFLVWSLTLALLVPYIFALHKHDVFLIRLVTKGAASTLFLYHAIHCGALSHAVATDIRVPLFVAQTLSFAGDICLVWKKMWMFLVGARLLRCGARGIHTFLHFVRRPREVFDDVSDHSNSVCHWRGSLDLASREGACRTAWLLGNSFDHDVASDGHRRKGAVVAGNVVCNVGRGSGSHPVRSFFHDQPGDMLADVLRSAVIFLIVWMRSIAAVAFMAIF